MADKSKFCGLAPNVLGYREDSKWVALALEMDIRGHGDTFESALEELADLVGMQVSFAEHKGQPEMVLHPAEPIFFSLYAQIRADRLSHLTAVETNSEYQIGGIPVPEAHVISANKDKFSVMNG